MEEMTLLFFRLNWEWHLFLKELTAQLGREESALWRKLDSPRLQGQVYSRSLRPEEILFIKVHLFICYTESMRWKKNPYKCRLWSYRQSYINYQQSDPRHWKYTWEKEKKRKGLTTLFITPWKNRHKIKYHTKGTYFSSAEGE